MARLTLLIPPVVWRPPTAQHHAQEGINVFTRIWLAAAGTRALRTLAQVAVATIGTTAVIDGVDWRVVASTAGLAAILSLLTSLAGLPEVTEPVVPEAAPRHVADDGHARWQETTTEAEADAQAAGNDRTAFPYA